MKYYYVFGICLAFVMGCGEEASVSRELSSPSPEASPLAAGEFSEPAVSPSKRKTLAVKRPPAREVARAALAASRRVVAAARKEVARKAGYDPDYYALEYPGGDVPGGGACTDLVVRALRAAGHDLQKLVHEDKRANPDAYPQLWTRRAADHNIDHRRVPNLMCFMKRKGQWLSASNWRPGDIVFWSLGASGRKHCGVISDRKGKSGHPLVLHNISGAAEEDCLRKWGIIGHARYPRGAPTSVVAKTPPRTPPAVVDDDDVPKG
jgi:uncharacterized protein